MSLATTQTSNPSGSESLFTLDTIQRIMLWLMMASGWYVVIEPAPYEYLFALTLILYLPAGMPFQRAAAPLTLFLTLYIFGGILAVLPHVHKTNAVEFIIITIYMGVSAMFFSHLLATDTMRRFKIMMNGYVLAAVIASINGMIGYFDIFGMAEQWAPILRAQGTFKDPNVLSTFLILPAMYIVQNFLTGKQRHPIISAIALIIIMAAIFFAFSRGAWVSTLASGLMMVTLTFMLAPHKQMKTRVALLSIAGFILLVIMMSVALSFEFVRTLFIARANLINSYDAGETGRFGIQLASLPYLLTHPNGTGARQFAILFGADPHNIIIHSFATYGWIGGFTYIAMIAATFMIGIKTIFSRTPWQFYAIAVWCPLLFTILQGVQIDTEHWRHFYILLGSMWGFYAATVKYERGGV